MLPFVCGWYVEFLIDLSVRNTTKHTKNTKKFQANDLSIQKRIGFQRIKHHPLDVSISLRSASRPKWTRASGCIITIPSAQAEAEARHRCVKNCKFDAWKMKMDANCRHDSPWKSESHLDLWFFVEMNLEGSIQARHPACGFGCQDSASLQRILCREVWNCCRRQPSRSAFIRTENSRESSWAHLQEGLVKGCIPQ